MAQSRKEKGIAQLRKMLTRWQNIDSEFRQYISWRVETLRLIGAGNTSGLFAIALFLTTGARTGGIVGAAKICLLLFFIGFGAFFFAYRTLYRCAGHMEDCLLALRAGGDVSSSGVNKSVSSAIDESERSGVLVMVSTICFVVASVIAVVGLLLS